MCLFMGEPWLYHILMNPWHVNEKLLLRSHSFGVCTSMYIDLVVIWNWKKILVSWYIFFYYVFESYSEMTGVPVFYVHVMHKCWTTIPKGFIYQYKFQQRLHIWFKTQKEKENTAPWATFTLQMIRIDIPTYIYYTVITSLSKRSLKDDFKPTYTP